MDNIMNKKNITAIEGAKFDPDTTFDCGQCFRWERQEDGAWQGVAHNRILTVRRQGESILLEGTDSEEFEQIWKRYFDLDRDYSCIKELLCGDGVLEAAIGFAPGMRILRQEPWEALCSFIISQNNNIPRIKGIISRLCESFGDEIAPNRYSFPDAQRIAALSPDELAPLRCGFRAGYITDAAQKVASGAVDLDSLSTMPLDEARAMLKTIKGVGPKVADCALLFGCGRLDCFPVDVWIKRALEHFYPNGFPQEYMQFGGIAQQFLFHYARRCPQSGCKF